MKLIVVAGRAKHRQSHTSTRLAAIVRTCCPMLLVAELDCNCKPIQYRHVGIGKTLQSMLTPHTCSTACVTGPCMNKLVVRAGTAALWKPSVRASGMSYLFEQDTKPSEGQGHQESLHLYWHRTHLTAIVANPPEHR